MRPDSFYIKRIKLWLQELGLSPEKKDDTTLKVALRSVSERYVLYFQAKNGYVSCRSYVFPTVTGAPENINKFKDILLALSNTMGPLAFALSLVKKDDSGDQWRVILRASQRCDTFNPHALKELVDHYLYTYRHIIPRVKAEAEDLQLEFKGTLSSAFLDLLQGILR